MFPSLSTCNDERFVAHLLQRADILEAIRGHLVARKTQEINHLVIEEYVRWLDSQGLTFEGGG